MKKIEHKFEEWFYGIRHQSFKLHLWSNIFLCNDLLPQEDGSMPFIPSTIKEAEIIVAEGMGCGIREPWVGVSALHS